MRPAPRPALPRLPNSSRRIELPDGGWGTSGVLQHARCRGDPGGRPAWAPRDSDRTGNRPHVGRQQGDHKGRPYIILGRHDCPREGTMSATTPLFARTVMRRRHDASREKRATALYLARPDKIEPKHYRCWHVADGNSHRLDRKTQPPTGALWSGLTGQ